MDDLTARLLDEGVRGLSAAFDALLGSIEKERAGVLRSALDQMSYRLLPSLVEGDQAALEDWRAGGKVRLLWARDATLPSLTPCFLAASASRTSSASRKIFTTCSISEPALSHRSSVLEESPEEP